MNNTKQISNAYREIGVLHNDGLDFIINNLDPTDPVVIEKIIELTSQYMQNTTDKITKLDFAFYYNLIATNINRLNQIPFDEILKESKISNEALCYIKEILNISNDFDYITTLKVLLNIEANILNSELTEQERELPLVSVAVAKSSVEYWIIQINETESLWTPFVGDPVEFAWPWKSDAKGAISGAIGGVLEGPAGILIGSLLGAIAASVADAIIRN
jgi:hypothetical protein